MPAKRKKAQPIAPAASRQTGARARGSAAPPRPQAAAAEPLTAGRRCCGRCCFRCPTKLPSSLLRADFMTMVFLLCLALAATSLAIFTFSLVLMRGTKFLNEVTTVWIPVMCGILKRIQLSDCRIVAAYTAAAAAIWAGFKCRDWTMFGAKFVMPFVAVVGSIAAHQMGLMSP